MFVIAREKIQTLGEKLPNKVPDDEFWTGLTWGDSPKEYPSKEEAQKVIETNQLTGEQLAVLDW